MYAIGLLPDSTVIENAMSRETEVIESDDMKLDSCLMVGH